MSFIRGPFFSSDDLRKIHGHFFHVPPVIVPETFQQQFFLIPGYVVQEQDGYEPDRQGGQRDPENYQA